MIFYVDIVGSCNLRCAGCPSSVFDKRTPERMSVSLWSRILERILSDYPATYIGFYNWSEPLLHPELDQFIARTKEKRPKIITSVSSNLSLRNIDPLLRAIEEGLDQLIVSLSGFSQEVHSKYHISGDIELVKANIQKVARYRATSGHGTGIDVHFLQFKDNLKDGELVKRFCTEVGVNYFPKDACYAKGVDGAANLLRLKWAPDPKRIDKEVDLEGVPRSFQESMSEPCEQVFDVIALDCTGEVFLCCSRYYLDDYRVGNFLEMTPEEILYRKTIHPECYICRGQRRPATAEDFKRLQKAIYFAARKDSAQVKQLLTGNVYQFAEYKKPQRG